MLSDSEDGSGNESINRLTINEHYAKAFEYKKEREELSKLKEQYGSDPEDVGKESESDSEEDVSEDEDGEELTATLDAAILRTLARIKKKDPAIYDSKKSVFEEEQSKVTSKAISRAKKDKSKPVTVRQAALASALNPASRSPTPEPATHTEEQRALRDETIAAFHHAVGEDENDDGLLVPREKTKDEQEMEEEEYKEFLKREVGKDLEGLITVEDDGGLRVDKEESKKKSKKEGKKERKKEGDSKSKEEDDQAFLMNYILNRGWIDRSTRHVPTYKEVTRKPVSDAEGFVRENSIPEGGEDNEGAEPDLEDENEFEEVNEFFETSYNFRFEEPDAAAIKTYPRTLASTVRREESTRKDARQRRKERKEEELVKKREEIKRLKVLKMKDIRSKLERIGKEGGKHLDEEQALEDLDLEADWDPEAHDKQMRDLYGEGEEEEAEELERPQWDDDIDIGNILPEETSSKKSKSKKKKKKDEDREGYDGVDVDAMDADVEQNEEEWDGTEEMRKRKLDEYMDEIYGLDFNDIVGGLPTRFGYTPVQSQSFALTPAEILMATDTELNQYLSVKKYAPYRKEVKWDGTRNERLKELKQKVSERVGATGKGEGITELPAKRRMGKKERMKLKAVAEANSEEPDPKRKRDIKEDGPVTVSEAGEPTKKKRRRHKKTAIVE